MVVLYVDDDADDCELFHELLKMVDPGIECTHAANGNEAIKFLKQGRTPDCIFLDINMPHLNGKETIIALKNDERFRSIPVVMYTTSNRDLDRKMFLGLGAMAYIVKGSNFEDAVADLKDAFVLTAKQINGFR